MAINHFYVFVFSFWFPSLIISRLLNSQHFRFRPLPRPSLVRRLLLSSILLDTPNSQMLLYSHSSIFGSFFLIINFSHPLFLYFIPGCFAFPYMFDAFLCFSTYSAGPVHVSCLPLFPNISIF